MTDDPANETTGRLYGGLNASARKAQRRDRLVAAGLHLFGTNGFGEVTIEALCAEAAVGIRAFYEEFGSRDALFTEVYFELANTAFTELQAEVMGNTELPLPERMRNALLVHFHFVLDDPRRARIMYVDTPRGDLELAQKRIDSSERFAKLAAAAIAGGTSVYQGNLELWSMFMIGGVRAMVVHWMGSDSRPEVDELATEAAQFLARSLGA
ncbi:MAG: TetR/AcrR family transcriptional regulator [Myxococcota bacterium]